MQNNASRANDWIDNRVALNRVIFCRGIIIDREHADTGGGDRSYDGIVFKPHSPTKVNFDLEIFNQIVTDENILTGNTPPAKHPPVSIISSNRLFMTIKKAGFCDGDSFRVVKIKSAIRNDSIGVES